MKILSIDYGSKRTGVAVCDELGLTAHGIATIVRKNNKQVLDALARLISDYGVEKIVIGYPLRLDGSHGIQCEKVDRFAEKLEKTFSLPVIKWDESLTTKEAEEILFQSNVRRKKKKGIVDQLAAALILKDYLSFLEREKGNQQP
jgi:putative Holliday junction resolvase